MKRSKWLIVIAILAIVGFSPVFHIPVVPEWTFRLIDKDGQPVTNAKVIQSWKDYSLEFWRFPHEDGAVSSADTGTVTLPARSIRVSILQIIVTKIVDVISAISPHSSSGPHSYLLCSGSINCSAAYKPGKALPDVVVVKR